MLTKMVNGEEAILSPEEEAAIEAERAANAIEQAESRRVIGIKTEARSRIIKQIPGGTMDNYLEKENLFHAEYSELQDVLLEGGLLTTEQAAYKAELKAMFNVMRDIILMSNTAETNLDPVDTYIAALDAKGY